MRIGPLGALFRSQPDEVLREVVFNVSLVTHRTVEAPTGAYAVAWAVKRFVLGASAAQVRAGLEGQAAHAEHAFARSQQTAKKPDWFQVANGGSLAAVYGKVLRRAEELRAQKVSRQELWRGVRLAVSDAARAYVESSGGSKIDGGGRESTPGKHDEDVDVETSQQESAAQATKGKNEDATKGDQSASVTPGEEEKKTEEVAIAAAAGNTQKAAAKAKAKAKPKEKKKEEAISKPRLHAFNPNQGHVTLGAMHALMLCILDNSGMRLAPPNYDVLLTCNTTEIGDPNEMLLGIIECGYDTDTVCAIAGSVHAYALPGSI